MQNQLPRFKADSQGIRKLTIDFGADHDPYMLTLEPPRYEGGVWTARSPYGVLAVSVDGEKAARAAVTWAEALRTQHTLGVA